MYIPTDDFLLHCHATTMPCYPQDERGISIERDMCIYIKRERERERERDTMHRYACHITSTLLLYRDIYVC